MVGPTIQHCGGKQMADIVHAHVVTKLCTFLRTFKRRLQFFHLPPFVLNNKGALRIFLFFLKFCEKAGQQGNHPE